jgi:hypothetical protein
MNFACCLRILLLTTLAVTVRAREAGKGATARDSIKAAVADLPVAARCSISTFLRVGIASGALHEELVLDLPDQETLQRVEIEGSSATWTVRKRALGGAADLLYVTINRYDFNAPADQFWNIATTLSPNGLMLHGVRGDEKKGVRVRLTQSKGSLSFVCWKMDQGAEEIFFRASAPSIRQLYGQHPREVRRYLSPLLHDLTGKFLLRPGAADVYRLFETIPADREIANELNRVIGRLESNSFPVREQAGKDLSALGAPFVLAALRRDLSDLSADAKEHLDRFIAEHSNAQWDDLDAARKDRLVLLDCLEDEDQAVRAASKAALEKVVGKKIEFDVLAGAEAREKMIEGLRAELEKEGGK